MCVYLFLPCLTKSQEQSPKADTVRLSLEETESRFQNENLQLLASKFNMDASEVAIVQAKLWNNPSLSIEQNIYNQYTRKFLDVTSSGNTGIQIQQLIVLAGKRGKQIQLAAINKEVAECNFIELIRSLKYELRTDFYDLHFLQQSLKFYDESIPSVKKAIVANEGAYSNRSILLSEILRLKSLLLSLESERLGIINQISELENDLHVLLNNQPNSRSYYIPKADTLKLENLTMTDLNLDAMYNTAIEKRADYLIAKANVKSEETNLSLQKSLAVPDLTVGDWRAVDWQAI